MRDQVAADDRRTQPASMTSRSTNDSSKRLAASLQDYLVVLLGGEAGLRCGEIMALEWTDVDLNKRQLCVARSDWKGHVTVAERWAAQVCATDQAANRSIEGSASSTRSSGALRNQRSAADAESGSGDDAAGGQAGERKAGRPHPAPHVLFAPGDAWGAGESDSGTRGTCRTWRRRSATCT